MSELFKVSLVYTGNVNSIESYLDDSELHFINYLVELGCDIPNVLITESDKCSITFVQDGNTLIDKDFSTKEELVEYLRSDQFTSIGKSPNMEDIIGLYSNDDSITIQCPDCNGVELSIHSNSICKNHIVKSDTDLCILVDSRNPELKLNIDSIRRVLCSFKNKCILYSMFDKKDVVDILGNIDIEFANN